MMLAWTGQGRVNSMPGEARSCIGCHEPRALVPSAPAVTAATRSTRALEPQPGETVPPVVHYPLDVQPTFDQHCVQCHNATKADGGLDLSGTVAELFSTSLDNSPHCLLSKKQIFRGLHTDRVQD